MTTKSVIIDDGPERIIDPFLNDVWALVYNMIEAGDVGVDDQGRPKWWREEFLSVKHQLIRRGLNCDPEDTKE